MYRSRALWTLLAIGLALRLLYGWAQDPLAPYGDTGGDDTWYLAMSLALVTDAPAGALVNGIPAIISKLNQPPVFFLVAGIPQALLPPGPAVQVLRVVQAVATTAVALFAFGLAVRLVGGLPGDRARLAHRAGLFGAAALALSPALIFESAQVKTESLYVFFVAGGVWAYVEALVRAQRSPRPVPALTPQPPLPQGEGERAPDQSFPPQPERAGRGALSWFVLAGVLLGLATLTRAVFLVFPLALVVFTLFALGPRRSWKHALLLLAVYGAVVLTWTAYNLVRYQRLVIAGEGLASFVYLGAAGWDGPENVDQRLTEQLGAPEDGSRDQGEFLQAAGGAIGADVPGYLARRLGELGGALLQPHNVELFHSPSLRRMIAEWWESDRSLAGALAVAQGNAFVPKLLLYVVHYTGLALGLVGVLVTARAWRVSLPMLGYIGYVLLIHLVLLALPRYVFPITPFVWVFAASALSVLSRKY